MYDTEYLAFSSGPFAHSIKHIMSNSNYLVMNRCSFEGEMRILEHAFWTAEDAECIDIVILKEEIGVFVLVERVSALLFGSIAA